MPISISATLIVPSTPITTYVEEVVFQGATDVTWGVDSVPLNVRAQNPISVAYPKDVIANQLIAIPTAGGSIIRILKEGVYYLTPNGNVDIEDIRIIPGLDLYKSTDDIATAEPIISFDGNYHRVVGDDLSAGEGGQQVIIYDDNTLIEVVPVIRLPTVQRAGSYDLPAGLTLRISRFFR